jgi:hypothetical protein
MKVVFDSARRAAGVTGVVVMLAACGGSQPAGNLGAIPPGTAPALTRDARSMQPAACTWKIAASVNPGSNNLFNGVSGSSPSDVWAVGKFLTPSGPPSTLAEHWNGAAWSVVTTPTLGLGSVLTSVSSVSASDVWAVGRQIPSSGPAQTLILHFGGSSWSAVTAPTIPGDSTAFYDVKAISATDVWALGNATNPSGLPAPFAAHYDGKTWKIIPTVNPGTFGSSLGTLAASGPKDVWAIGGTFTNGSESSFVTLTEHWNGKHFSVVKSPNANTGDNVLNGAVAIASNDAWAIGDYYTGTVFATLTEHWNGKAWSIVKSPNAGTHGNGLYGATAFSSKSVWAVGQDFTATGSTTLSIKWNGKAWAVVKSPNLPGGNADLFARAAAIPGSTTLWAIGNSTYPSGPADQTLAASNACAG